MTKQKCVIVVYRDDMPEFTEVAEKYKAAPITQRAPGNGSYVVTAFFPDEMRPRDFINMGIEFSELIQQKRFSKK
jgi:hypothetical protein